MNGSSDPSLRIVLELVDNASKQLDAAQKQFTKFADGVSTSIKDASLPVIQFQDDIAKEAQKASDLVVNYWTDATGAVVHESDDLANLVIRDWQTIASEAQKAATDASQAWQQSSTYSQQAVDDLTARFATDTAQIEADGRKAGEQWALGVESGLSSAKHGMGGFYGYFALTMGASMAGQVGGSLTGFTNSAISAAAAGSTKLQIQMLQSQIAQSQASIATQRASLTHLTGTTAQMAAKHKEVAAAIALETTKIALYRKQLQPLEAEQKISGKAAAAYADAVQKLHTDWQTFLATSGKGLMKSLTSTLELLDKIVIALTNWAKQNPVLAKYIMGFIGILGGLFTILSSVLYTLASIKIATMLMGDGFSSVTSVISGARTAMGAFATSAAFVWAGYFLILAAAIMKVYNATASLQKAMSVAQSAGTQALNSANSAAYQKLLQNSTGARHAQLQQAYNQSVQYGLSAQSYATRYSGVGGALNAFIDNPLAFTKYIPKLASGGIINRPTVALVGEAGPEAVIPLSSFAGGSSLAGAGGFGGAAGINVNIMGGYYLDRNAADQIGRALAKRVTQNLRVGNYNP